MISYLGFYAWSMPYLELSWCWLFVMIFCMTSERLILVEWSKLRDSSSSVCTWFDMSVNVYGIGDLNLSSMTFTLGIYMGLMDTGLVFTNYDHVFVLANFLPLSYDLLNKAVKFFCLSTILVLLNVLRLISCKDLAFLVLR